MPKFSAERRITEGQDFCRSNDQGTLISKALSGALTNIEKLNTRRVLFTFRTRHGVRDGAVLDDSSGQLGQNLDRQSRTSGPEVVVRRREVETTLQGCDGILAAGSRDVLYDKEK